MGNYDAPYVSSVFMAALGAYNSTSNISLNQWDNPHARTHVHINI